MQINVCRKSTDYQNLKKYFAAILKFENYALFARVSCLNKSSYLYKFKL